jgi:ATP-dependent RNA helicase DDX5/DBP2
MGGGYGGGYGGGMGFGGGKGMGKGGDRMGGLGANLERIRWDDQKLVTFTKDFYHEHPAVAARGPADVEAIRAEHQLQIVSTGKGDYCPKPVRDLELY